MTRERPITHAMKRRSAVPFLAAACAIACGAGPAPAVAARHHDRVERSVIRKINFIRSAYGLPHVRPLTALRHAAEEHSRDMARANFFDHPSSDGTSFDARIRRYSNASLLGETLAMTSRRNGGAGGIVQMWMNSPPHRAIMLDARFRKVGVGRRWGSLNGDGYAVVTADFAR